MSKENLRYPDLRTAMSEIQKARAEETGGHTWQDLVEHYGQSILFAEIASIVSRLEAMFWVPNPYADIYLPEPQVDRALDLLIDLGNFTEFLYISVQDEEERLARQLERSREVVSSIGKKVRAEAEHDEEPS